MEHALPSPPGQGHPWRTIAVVAAGVATLELLGLVVVGVALIAKPVMNRARAEATAAPAKHDTAKVPVRALLPRGATSVTVLNGNGQAGAAAGTGLARTRARVRSWRGRQRPTIGLRPKRRHVPSRPTPGGLAPSA